MAWHGWVARAGATMVTGVVGAATYDVARRAVRGTPVRESAVILTAAGLRGTRKAEEVAESVRLATGDIVAEARERLGEDARVPGAPTMAHDHAH